MAENEPDVIRIAIPEDDEKIKKLAELLYEIHESGDAKISIECMDKDAGSDEAAESFQELVESGAVKINGVTKIEASCISCGMPVGESQTGWCEKCNEEALKDM